MILDKHHMGINESDKTQIVVDEQRKVGNQKMQKDPGLVHILTTFVSKASKKLQTQPLMAPN